MIVATTSSYTISFIKVRTMTPVPPGVNRDVGEQDLLVRPSIATGAFHNMLLPICSRPFVFPNLLINMHSQEMTLRKEPASAECTSNEAVQYG